MARTVPRAQAPPAPPPSPLPGGGDGPSGQSTDNPNPGGKLSIALSLPSPTEEDRDNEDNDASTVEEGAKAFFQLTASPAPQSGVTVSVTVLMCVTGEPFTAETGLRQKTIDVTASKTKFKFHIQTDNDLKDEDSGTIAVELQGGTGYDLVAGQTTASVKVYDNDAPAGLRANGHLVIQGLGPDRGITLRWDESETTKYGVRFVELTCIRDGSCAPVEDGRARVPITIPNISTLPSQHVADTTEEVLLGLRSDTLYQVGVGSADDFNWYYSHKDKRNRGLADASAWPEAWAVVLVYPTGSPPSVITSVAGIPVEAYQAQGKYTYTICDPAQAPQNENDPSQIPNGFSVDGANNTISIKDIISAWDSAVVWRKANGDNVIQTSGSRIVQCEDPDFDRPHTRNQIVFVSDEVMEFYCPNGDPRACVRAGDLASPTPPRSIIVRDSVDWDEQFGVGCKALHSTLRHEIGHALGLHELGGEFRGWSNSVMISHYELRRKAKVCTPTEQDAVAIMANYQSR